jgi:hypothetical protein
LDHGPYPPHTKLIIHPHNAQVHTANKCQQLWEENNADHDAYPPSSPGHAPSNFFLRGCVKDRRRERKFKVSQDLLDVIREMLSTVSPEIVISVFEEWPQ